MKFNLLNFWQLHIRKLTFVIGIIMTILFITIYFRIPAGEYFDFIIYALAILYSLIFFILSAIQTLIETSIEASYNHVKKKYQNGLDVYRSHCVAIIFAKTSEEINGRSLLNSFPEVNIYHGYFANEGPKFKVEPELISFNKYYLTYESYLSSREWRSNSFFTKLNLKLYNALQRFYNWRFRNNLNSAARCYGDKLHIDLINEKADSSFQKDVLSSLEYIEDRLKDIESFLDYLDKNDVVTSIIEKEIK